MNKEEFFKYYPKRKDDSNKFDNGRLLIIGGSYGMAGACIYNIIGARCVGASYIDVYLPDEIYEIVAKNEISAVYHPEIYKNDDFIKLNAFKKANAICFGSGLTNLNNKEKYLKLLLENSSVYNIIDAEGLNIISDNNDYLSINNKLILTPHLGEFSKLTKLSIKEIEENKIDIALNYARRNNVILILKGPHTLVVNNDGKLYINDSGNSALARAGSGDLLTGMLTGLVSLYDDPYIASKHAVWLHGYLADMGIKEYSKEIFDLKNYPLLADKFFLNKD